MFSAVATILAAVISAAISVSVAMISYASARSASESAIEAKINELKQGQITEILHQRIERYPSLWKLCQESFAVPSLMRSPPPEGWNVELSKALESWHAEHGVFLSQESYLGVWYLRKRARQFATLSPTAEAALVILRELYDIWTQGAIDSNGMAIDAVAMLLKNDLGSYDRAALSTRNN